MTGDIQTKLVSSEAAELLRMEKFIADCFRSHGWPAEQGVYFTDPESRKVREVDVLSRQVLDRPRRHTGVGSPLINLSIICECKSLSGWNVLLQKGDLDRVLENRLVDHWSGFDEHVMEIVDLMSQERDYRKCDKRLLYSYYNGRAYPDGLELACHMTLLQPAVDLIATAFRATKGGSDEREAINPFWSAIQSVLSATTAAKISAVETMKSYTHGFKPYASEQKELVENIAFFFDTELARRVLVHPVIFCKSRLFSVLDDMTDIRSARILVRNLNFDNAAGYIGTMLSDFEKQAHKSIRKTWNRLEELRWQPAQGSKQLAQALGLSKRTRAKPTT